MRRNSGFTLAEVLVSLVISSIVLLAVGAVFIGVQNSYERLSRSQSAIDGNRTAIAYIERQVRLAGYGIDPALAFDFTSALTPASNPRDNGAIDEAATAPTVPAPAVVTDDLTVRYRDPNWVRRGNLNAGGTSLSLETGATAWGVGLRAGRRLLVTCPSGGGYGVYTLGAAITPATTGAQAVARVAAAPFPTGSQPSCLEQTGVLLPYVSVLQERRMRIRNVGGRPFLVAYDRLDQQGDSDFDPIAADVEDFQVAFVMNVQPSNSNVALVTPAIGTNWILGDGASPEAFPNPGSAAPRYDDAYDTANRYTDHPANIRAVRVSVVTRSRTQRQGVRDATPYSLENNVRGSATPDGFFRLLSTTTIRAPNMQSRSSFTPDLRTTAGEGNFNGG